MSQNSNNSSILLKKRPTAGLAVIGNEILSGSVADKNINYIAKRCREYGIELMEVRIIADIQQDIITALDDIRKKYDYIFTTGGIGPTHDDITASSVAKLFNQNLVQNDEAHKMLKSFYKARNEELNYGRLKMAMMPEGAIIIPNKISSAPGFYIDNIYVFAGIPKIMQVMFEEALLRLNHGEPIKSVSVKAQIIEGDIAESLELLQDEYKNVEIGSYPKKEGDKFIVIIIICGDDYNLLLDISSKTQELIINYGGKIIENSYIDDI